MSDFEPRNLCNQRRAVVSTVVSTACSVNVA